MNLSSWGEAAAQRLDDRELVIRVERPAEFEHPGRIRPAIRFYALLATR